DLTVTGVQTCALPISGDLIRTIPISADCSVGRIKFSPQGNLVVGLRGSNTDSNNGIVILDLETGNTVGGPFFPGDKNWIEDLDRSEERRVGKECRVRW